MSERIRHVTAYPKENTTLTIDLRNRIPDFEYVSYNTSEDLPES